MAIVARNLLAQALGFALRHERERQNKTVQEVVDQIPSISAPYYRLCESGTNHLHSNKALAVVNALDGTVSLDALIKLLTCISTTEVEIKSSSTLQEYSQRFVAILEQFSVYETNQLGKLIELFLESSLVSDAIQQDPKEADKLLRSSGLGMQVYEYLVHYPTYARHLDERIENALYNKAIKLPSIYAGLIHQLLDQLAQLAVPQQPNQLYRWEAKNQDFFRSLHVFTNSAVSVVGETNLANYTYPYLTNSDFKNVRILIIGDNTSDELKKEFSENLVKSVGGGSGPRAEELQNAIDKKVGIRSVPPTSGVGDGDDIGNLVRLVLGEEEPRGSRTYDACWIFEIGFDSNATILAGFVGNLEQEHREMLSTIESISFEQATKKYAAFETIWDQRR